MQKGEVQPFGDKVWLIGRGKSGRFKYDKVSDMYTSVDN